MIEGTQCYCLRTGDDNHIATAMSLNFSVLVQGNVKFPLTWESETLISTNFPCVCHIT